MTSQVLEQDITAGSLGGHAPGRVKVTYILGSLRDGGTERQVLELVRHLDRARFEPSLILMEPTNIERSDGLVSQRLVMGIPQAGNSRWFPRSLALLKAGNLTRKYLRQIHSDVVHAFLPGPCILGCAAARVAGVPSIVGSRRSLPSHYRSRSRVAAWADRAAFHFAHCNLGNSHAVSSEMTEIAGCPTAKCMTIYNGVDQSRFHPHLSSSLRQELGWTNGEVVFGMVANFRECKRHLDFLAAAAMISKRHGRARFLLVGADQGTRESVVRQVAALGLGDKVRILAATSSPETIFPALDVYVCTSEAEGFSNVLLEAMACGKPVIATHVGGNAEAMLHGETGFLVPPNEPALTADAAARLVNEPALRGAMGLAGRSRVESEFSLDRMVRAHERLYLSLLDKHRLRPA